MTRFERAHIRRVVFEIAHRYLGVKRLPAGVPRLLNEYVNGLTVYPSADDATVPSLLHPYRKLPWWIP